MYRFYYYLNDLIDHRCGGNGGGPFAELAELGILRLPPSNCASPPSRSSIPCDDDDPLFLLFERDKSFEFIRPAAGKSPSVMVSGGDGDGKSSPNLEILRGSRTDCFLSLLSSSI
ncbi:hypothetical protein DERP_007820 [Dermatophagoides pteronyssinus]|uniref:Uncharacterized protein n=1 Tax=Dermatophagoides pteronyssinus TaxID=6956 RepID=A0ABQ8ISQ8_DERPT|nr:hypothetical protein DERP_007820 [Dermatophagoides pteronyssinus]